jgi:hypothetical protein
VIATCPLKGDHYRLVNRDARDLEVHVRDLEFVLGWAKQRPFADADKIGVIGYDMGGLAGLLMVMRNPQIKVFLSMDSAVDYEYLPIPKNHFSYRENNFTIPWMHMTESRFVDYFENQLKQSSLIKRKKYGPSYLVKIPTTNHGCFTSYAALGLQNPVTAYWESIEKNLQDLHVLICRQARLFFDAYLKDDEESLMTLKQRSRGNDLSDSILTFDYNEGLATPPRFDGLVHSIISRGLKEVNGEIEQLRKTHAPQDLFINILKKHAKKKSFGDDAPKEHHQSDREWVGGATPLFDEEVLNVSFRQVCVWLKKIFFGVFASPYP